MSDDRTPTPAAHAALSAAPPPSAAPAPSAPAPFAGPSSAGYPSPRPAGAPEALVRAHGLRAALVAGGVAGLLWLLAGLVTGLMIRTGQVGTLYTPGGMAVSVGGRVPVDLYAAAGLLVVTAVVAGVVALAVRGQVRGYGRVALFLAGWFAAVLASVLGTMVQLVRIASEYPADRVLDTLVLPALRSAPHWGMTVGWLVGLAVVLAAGLRQRHGALR